MLIVANAHFGEAVKHAKVVLNYNKTEKIQELAVQIIVMNVVNLTVRSVLIIFTILINLVKKETAQIRIVPDVEVKAVMIVIQAMSFMKDFVSLANVQLIIQIVITVIKMDASLAILVMI